MAFQWDFTKSSVTVRILTPQQYSHFEDPDSLPKEVAKPFQLEGLMIHWESFPVAKELYSQCFDELIRQVRDDWVVGRTFLDPIF